MSSLVQIRRGPAPHASSERGPQPELEPEPTADIVVATDAPRVYLETFGCQMNEADSALIAGRLREGGYVRVRDPAQADVVLVNTCAIREKAEDRVVGRTSQLLRHRADNPGLVIGITGCMAEHLKTRVAQRAPHITLVAGPDSYRSIAALCDRARAGERVIDVRLDKAEVYEGLAEEPDDDGISGFVTIQRGCDKFCTFCVVPYTRGRERGVPPREVLRAVRARAQAGYREVVLLGQTVNSYRHEDVGFAELLAAVHEVEGIERIRFTSPYPVDFSPALVDAMARLPKVCPQVHLPAQSGCTAVLERMRRGYTRDQFVALVARLRQAVPGIALSTDLMVGFCGETEDEHAQTLALMDEVRFDSAFMFAYSDRGITYASKKMSDDVPEAVKKQRLQQVIERQEQHTRASHEARVGTRQRVLVSGTSRRGDRLVGRTESFHKVLLPLHAAAPGDLLDVTITGSTGHSLWAEPAPSQRH
ncbi:tRNA (N6-isopentenyl adenosine(37)-C2)-methylthiotransferase MiaB [Paraliomyxa miuraensis]|uniref:tRNA (N6-isopentenyl adenosine(37)-C2)-methylthiotransferase MiaB n=1 Tax=Paraliomyxa miuraensis TaxID=376150 RepID=UPI00224DECD2|nr:tRNA (N6-isopentenyl adenosine(37)-C2)-methylthiotransferase MiaB [Paraliomyxa miuraensis]MCX4239953.1 tRNA (N6-isopentenyl adenosine(37)-C2)-methylthiotransferase MiaB [Paraliomyxa miuraensis]